ncbi:pyrroline-5-carboxylate reductase [Pseudoroseicyclus aestuarii]|uniref:Pyrroline-5-carboxylate reductase n=1 Tax=Pseudoroseicyclus aestuarii TaxID=1795041 RepID=A0A318SV10_9RHOB|nr:pyrroline-5-carboxylate reductase [Pseudoroseicyclus aestuarii]PYE84126.1 pyrroline-5-carboxylate reductase [Pseudoroseicyclus aestuarii]
MDDLATRGVVLLGCGKMGGALLSGWLSGGLPPEAVTVVDPRPSDWLSAQGIRLNAPLPEAPAVLILAVKPQLMGEALPQVTRLGGGGTLVISIAAGTSLATLEEAFGADTPIVRVMPNTPAAIGQGISAMIGNAAAGEAHLDRTEALMRVTGPALRLQDEAQMDAVTGVSGSGPAYVFHMIECLAAAGEAEGLPPEMAMQLATQTVAGAGALAAQAQEAPDQLRRNVTSPNGTTQAGLEVLMDEEAGLPPLVRRTVAAAAGRSRELSRG